MNGAEWLARALAGAGTTHVFFVESVLRRTLLQLQDFGVTPILAHSEKAAAYMADGYARVMRRPAVCMAQSVGAANLASGLQDPYLGRSPVIALTGRKEPSFQHRNAYQEIAHAPLFAAVTKFSTPVDTTGELPRLLRYAWRAALADTPRPTHLDFSGLQGDVIELGQTSETPVIDPEARRIPAHRPVADAADIERAATALTAARRVAIVAGDGAAASEAGPELLALAEALAAPLATTLGARGIIPTTHRLSAGVAGSYSAPPANRIVNGAELVLFVGCDTGDQVTLNWTVPPRPIRIRASCRCCIACAMHPLAMRLAMRRCRYPSASGSASTHGCCRRRMLHIILRSNACSVRVCYTGWRSSSTPGSVSRPSSMKH